MTSIAEIVGENVARLRQQREWSQGDLEAHLAEPGNKWTRTAVGMLETRGIRGERISDLIQLCLALDQPLTELLSGDGSVTLKDGSEHTLTDVRRALFEPRPPASPVGAKGPLKVAQDDPKESAKLERSIQASEHQWSTLMDYIKETTGAQPSLTAYRDFLGDVRREDTREGARRKRISGTRQLRALLAQLDERSPEKDSSALKLWSEWSAGSWPSAATNQSND